MVYLVWSVFIHCAAYSAGPFILVTGSFQFWEYSLALLCWGFLSCFSLFCFSGSLIIRNLAVLGKGCNYLNTFFFFFFFLPLLLLFCLFFGGGLFILYSGRWLQFDLTFSLVYYFWFQKGSLDFQGLFFYFSRRTSCFSLLIAVLSYLYIIDSLYSLCFF